MSLEVTNILDRQTSNDLFKKKIEYIDSLDKSQLDPIKLEKIQQLKVKLQETLEHERSLELTLSPTELLEMKPIKRYLENITFELESLYLGKNDTPLETETKIKKIKFIKRELERIQETAEFLLEDMDSEHYNYY